MYKTRMAMCFQYAFLISLWAPKLIMFREDDEGSDKKTKKVRQKASNRRKEQEDQGFIYGESCQQRQHEQPDSSTRFLSMDFEARFCHPCRYFLWLKRQSASQLDRSSSFPREPSHNTTSAGSGMVPSARVQRISHRFLSSLSFQSSFHHSYEKRFSVHQSRIHQWG